MRALIIWVLIAVGSNAYTGCKTVDHSMQNAAAGPELSEVSADTDDGKSPVTNFGKVGPNLFRGGQLEKKEARFKFLQDAGVKTIINLQAFHSVDDARLCAKYDMTCIRHDINPLAIDWLPFKFDWENMKLAFADGKAALERGEGVFVHCYIGKDRTGALITALKIYPIVCSGSPYDAEALEKEISESYAKYGASWPMHGLRAEVISWAKNPPAWLCEKY